MKKKLELDDQTARSIYKIADIATKLVLESNWGKEFFSEKLSDRIKSYVDVCKELCRPILTIKDFKFLPENQRAKALANHQWENISELFNQGWKPDFTNINQAKYYVWYERKSTGWVVCYFSDRGYYSICGSGFYFKDSETALYVANTFLPIMTIILEP